MTKPQVENFNRALTRGYSTYQFEDGATITSRFSGTSRAGELLHGDYTVISGTGIQLARKRIMERSKFTRKELQMGIKEMMSARAQRFGELTGPDVIAMLRVASYDGTISQTEYEEIMQVASQYADKFNVLGLAIIQGVVRDLPNSGLVVSDNPPPRHSQVPPAAGIDPKIVGRWNYVKYYSAGTYSSTVSRDMVLYADGRFEEGGSVGANLRLVDSGGNWEGTSSAYAAPDPGEYGRWEAHD